MEQLSKKIITDKAILDSLVLPEKVIQFGTGVLLRGLPDYFIDKANKQGIFGGRIVVVKSTSGGDGKSFEQQDGLYTICIRGIEADTPIEKNIVCSAISRVLTAKSDWPKVLDCARQKNFEVIISNTTEVGIQLVKESVAQNPPDSFPAKLLAFLLERYNFFHGDPSAGMVILPTELLISNGEKLKAILIELAEYNRLEKEFIEWLVSHNRFCNTLVDCIVPGKPTENVIVDPISGGSYTDDLAIVTESYRLWAIEGGEDIKRVLSFHKADDGVKIEADITKYRELKLRLLNGTHTLSSGLACLASIATVRMGMQDSIFSAYVRNLMIKEIASAIPYQISESEKTQFSEMVLSRFKNPAIHHTWINITLQYTSKLATRVVPVLLRYYELNKTAPPFIAIGFAGYLRFMKSEKTTGGMYLGLVDGQSYTITDSQAEYLHTSWRQYSESDLIKTILGDRKLWGEDLTSLPGFVEKVRDGLEKINQHGVSKTLESLL